MPDVDSPESRERPRSESPQSSVNIVCEACGTSFKRQAILAMLIALGCKTRDPNDCWASDDGEHRWKESKT